MGNGGGSNLKEDGHRLYVSGDFGKLVLGGSGPGGTYYADVLDEVTNDEYNSGVGLPGLGYFTDALTPDEVISYHTPSLGGFSGGVSVSDAGSASKADGRELGVQYSGNLMDGSFTLKYAGSQYDGNGINGDPGNKEISVQHLSAVTSRQGHLASISAATHQQKKVRMQAHLASCWTLPILVLRPLTRPLTS